MAQFPRNSVQPACLWEHRSPLLASLLSFSLRNKRALTLDLKTDEAKEILWRLVKDADAIVHNIRAGGMRRLGFEYEKVKAVNPEIIYCHAVGYGSDGHYAERPAFDDLVQAASGAAYMLPMQDGSTEPRYFTGGWIGQRRVA